MCLGSQQLRALNEAPTVLLVAIVLAVLKTISPRTSPLWVIFGMIIAMAATIQLYAKNAGRTKKS